MLAVVELELYWSRYKAGHLSADATTWGGGAAANASRRFLKVRLDERTHLARRRRFAKFRHGDAIRQTVSCIHYAAFAVSDLRHSNRLRFANSLQHSKSTASHPPSMSNCFKVDVTTPHSNAFFNASLKLTFLTNWHYNKLFLHQPVL